MLLSALVLLIALSPVERPTHGTSFALERIEVTAVVDVDDAHAWLIDRGATIEVVSGARIQALVPTDLIDAVREASAVMRLEPPGVAVPLQSPGPADLAGAGVDRWHTAGFTGHGVHIAILDDGFAGYQARLGSTLPPASRVIAQSFRADGSLGESDHGVRAAEIVHAVAPGATLHLVNYRTVTELSAAVDYLIEQEVTAISFSLGYIHNGPGDGTGAVNEIVSRATAAGIAWVAASGNWAEQHWGGEFRDTAGDSVHQFQGDSTLNGHRFNEGDLITISLRWDDTWGASCSDYDLELFGPGGELVMASRTIQNCASDPVESLQVLATTTGTYRVRIIQADDDASESRRLGLMVVGTPDRGHPLEFHTPQRSLSEPADHPGVITVGALSAGGSEARYSSRGPTLDGRLKPDILAPTGVEGGNAAFSGTSASAPHVAGVIALFKEAFPAADRGTVTTMLQARASNVLSVSNGTPGVRRLDTGTLSGAGPLLPQGSEEAVLLGPLPPSGGLALLSYAGPDFYPARFVHLLAEGREIAAAYDYDSEAQAWLTWIRGAPAWVNSLETISPGTYLFRFAPVPVEADEPLTAPAP